MMKRILTALVLMPLMALAGTIGEALDCTSLTWTTGGDASWFTETSDTHDGQDAVRSGAVNDSQSSWMQTTITGAKQVSFWWKVSSESNYDSLKFYVDGSEKVAISGTDGGWRLQTISVTGSGTHTLKWQYSKDVSVYRGDDCGWVDQLVVTDLNGPSTTYYVNGATGSDSNSGLSENAAKRTIQAAIDVATEGSTIRVAAGTYAPIATENKALTIVGVEGRGNTHIDGNGSARCASLGESTNECATVLKGFTLKNGYLYISWDGFGGAGVKGGTLCECTITNCLVSGSWGSYGGRGGGAACSRLNDCEIVDCKALAAGGASLCVVGRCVIRNCYSHDDGGGAHECVLSNCLIVNNYGYNVGGYSCGYGLFSCEAYNCTIANNTGRSGGGVSSSKLYNCIIYGNEPQNIYPAGARSDETILENCVTVDPQFADAAAGNYRLAADSPCINAGDNSYVNSTRDLGGNARIAHGTVDVGCYEYSVRTAVQLWANGPYWATFNVGATLPEEQGYTFLYGDGNAYVREGGAEGAWVNVGTKVNPSASNPAAAYWGGDWRWPSSAEWRNLFTMCEYSFVTNNGATGWLIKGRDSYSDNMIFLPVPAPELEDDTTQECWLQDYRTDNGDVAQISSIVASDDSRRIGPCLVHWWGFAGSGALLRAVRDTSPVMNQTYSVIFEANGGTSVSSRRIEDGAAVGELPTATKDGAEFLGWFTAATGGTQVTATRMITGDVTFYAHWREISLGEAIGGSVYAVTTGGNANWFVEGSNRVEGAYAAQSGVISHGQSCWMQMTVTGANAVSFQWMVSSESRFDRLSVYVDGVEKDAISGSVDWSEKTLTVFGEGEHVIKWQYSKDGSVSSGDDCGRVDALMVTSIPEPEYTIVFDGNGSTGGSTVGLSAAYDVDVMLPANGFTRTGYTFAGWSRYNWGYAEYTNCATVRNLTSDAGATVTLYAVWTPISYSVSYYGNGADWGWMSTQWMTYDSWESLDWNQYGKTGYSFAGWATTADGAVSYSDGAYVRNLADTAGANTGLYAKWTLNHYAVTFNANGGSTDMSPVTRDYGTAIGAMTDAWRTGYDFLGWYTSASGGSRVTAATTVSGNMTIYAHWQLKTYTITVDANGGDAVPAFVRQHGSTIGSLPIPTRVGHVFKGWFTEPEAGERIGVSAVVTEDLALYAHWATYAEEIAIAMPGAENVRFATDDAAPWTRDASVSSDGESVRSYPIGANGESSMEAQVYGPGNFMFDWRVSSASRVGVLSYYVDGVKKKEISGSVDWRSVDIEISGAGTHTVRWVYAKSGSAVSGSDCGWVDAISWSGRPFPTVSYSVVFNVNGGDVSVPSVMRENGATLGTLPVPTRANAEFLGWFTAATGGSQVSATTVVASDMTLYAHWDVEIPVPGSVTVTFDANGGTCETGSSTLTAGASVGTLPNATRTGYSLVGWFTSATGGSQVSDSSIVNVSVTWYAHWQANEYAITYVDTKDAANPNPTVYTIEDVVTFAALPDVDGWRFVGWSVTGIPAGSTGDKRVTANWEESVMPVIGGDDDEPMDAGIANNYDGVIVDADGLPLGYIVVKAAKASGRGDAKKSKVTATIQMSGEVKKVTIKGDVYVSEATLVAAASDGRVLDLVFSHDYISGTFDGYAVEGVRNLLASTAKSDKGSAAKANAESVFNLLKGDYVMAYGDEFGYNGLSVSIATKGKVKISGKLANGTSVSTSSQLIVGEDNSVIPVIYTKGQVSLAFNIYFANDGTDAMVFGYYDAVISPVSELDSGCTFMLDESVYDMFDDYVLLDDFLPWDVSVEPSGTKWVVADGAKAGRIKMQNGEAVDTNESENPSGLKLTFTSRTGAFKGSFKVYALDANDKLKTFTATVSGVVVDGVGYGSATVKGRGTASVYIGN